MVLTRRDALKGIAALAAVAVAGGGALAGAAQAATAVENELGLIGEYRWVDGKWCWTVSFPNDGLTIYQEDAYRIALLDEPTTVTHHTTPEGEAQLKRLVEAFGEAYANCDDTPFVLKPLREDKQ